MSANCVDATCKSSTGAYLRVMAPSSDWASGAQAVQMARKQQADAQPASTAAADPLQVRLSMSAALFCDAASLSL